MLKKIRVIVSLIVITLITLLFVSTSDIASLHFLPKLQFVPAVLSLSIIIILSILLLTFLFGRIYCAVLCPMGIFQDIIIRISNLFKKKRKRRFKYRKPNNILRYAILAGIVIAFFSGLSIIVALLDPYSAYGRICVYLFKPIVLGINNVLAELAIRFNYRGLYLVGNTIPSLGGLIVAAVTFLVIAFMSAFFGRLFCNTICPVGTLLGVISKHSLFKIRIDKDACTKCNICSAKCKSSCIDVKNMEIDNSRCVECFNCIGACKNKGIRYRLEKSKAKERSTDEQKRMLLTTVLVGSLASIARADELKIVQEEISELPKRTPITPPGSKSIERFNKLCTSCNLCVSKCPANIIKPTLFDYGLSGILQPTMKFDRGFCNYNCTLCSEVCPTGAIEPLSVKEKHQTQIGKVIYIIENCVVYRRGSSCGACAEHCPTQAVRMVSYKGGITIPEVHTELCIGCGGCEYICPMSTKAIYVEGNTVHQIAKLNTSQQKEDIVVEGFGF